MKDLRRFGPSIFATVIFLMAVNAGEAFSQNPTMIAAPEQVFGEANGEPLLAEWKVTNATEVAMTIYVERNFVQPISSVAR